MCAAPGGKTAHLLSLGFPRVTAVEFSARRARKLQSNLQRLNLEERCETIVADGKSWIPAGGKECVDGVLLDVPCTATGTASRRPDVLRREEDLSAILESQYKLATHCADNILSSGGVMVYATCSLLKEESEDQVHKLLSRNEGAKLKTIPFTNGEIPGFDDAIDGNGWLRVLPGCLPGKLKSCDGFFVARLQKG
jgi:16S rRNA (cytosine967-C5)-methyltransferase